MQSVIPGLYASPPQPLPFAPSTHVRAFLLQRRPGNLLVYSAETVAGEASAIEELGGISRHYLNHWHEAAFGCGWAASTFAARLLCHENERQSVSKTCNVDETFSERHMVDDDFEVIPTPGHTAERPPSCGTAGGTAVCSRAIPSTSAMAIGSRRGSRVRAIVASTSRASSA
jgi:hypothetical protein